MNYIFFIGIDVSKSTLDFTALKDNQVLFHLQSSNDLAGIRGFWKQLKSQTGFRLEHALFCMEHTGIYNQHLLGFLAVKKAALCLESAIHIKRSSGLQRGKNDKVDAFRIAQYAAKNNAYLRIWEPKRPVIEQLKALTSLRSRILNARKQLSVALKESACFDKTASRESKKLCTGSLQGLSADLKKVEIKIDQLIDNDENLKHLFTKVTSVEGIGKITAIAMIVTSNEFKDITEPSKFACYSGVAPFEHSSGSSIRGRSRVSHLANKTMKTLLHMSAMAAICYNADLKEYYLRKTNEKKNKMCVINAIRNKLIQRVYACVKGDRLYEKNYRPVVV